MAIDIDGLAVLRAIAATPKLFPNAAAEINSFARKYVAAHLKPAAINLERLREIYRTIGGEAFPLILDSQADSASAALVKKLDKENPDVKTAPSDWLRRRIVELACSAAEPARKPLKAPGKKPGLTLEQKELAAGLKSKTVDLQWAPALWLDTGGTSFTSVLTSLTEKQTLDLVKRLDKDNPELKGASPEWCRQRIADLASGTAEPVFKNILESKAMAATRTRASRAK